MAVRAVAKDVTISPKKLLSLLDVIRGKSIEDARAILRAMPSPAAKDVAKVLNSAVANAETNQMMSAQDLRIVAVYADKGRVLKRFRPKPRGRAGRIRKRASKITVIVDERAE